MSERETTISEARKRRPSYDNDPTKLSPGLQHIVEFAQKSYLTPSESRVYINMAVIGEYLPVTDVIAISAKPSTKKGTMRQWIHRINNKISDENARVRTRPRPHTDESLFENDRILYGVDLLK